jgi:SAM-dependent methyltransferase
LSDAAITKAELERRLAEVIDAAGPWHFFNIHLGHGVYTMGREARKQEQRLEATVHAVRDLVGPFDGLRVLDLGCMEGIFALEFGRLGAEVIGIEARSGHVSRAEFARDALGLDNVEFRLDDVRNLSRETYGEFDIVLALGILYHLDAPSAFRFTEAVSDVTRRLALFDTHYALRSPSHWDYRGRRYSGVVVREHDPSDTEADRDRSFGSAVGNLESAWLTLPSLFNLLAAVGFSSTVEVRLPRLTYLKDRVCLAALKGVPGEPSDLVSPGAAQPDQPWAEQERLAVSHQQTLRERVMVRLSGFVPAGLRRMIISRRRRALAGRWARRRA